jgi:hypothetical protein
MINQEFMPARKGQMLRSTLLAKRIAHAAENTSKTQSDKLLPRRYSALYLKGFARMVLNP